MTATLSEDEISDAFHSYLKSSLAQAKAERLLDTDLLASAEADLMITGPALCLYFAALRCTTDPPSVPLPRLRKGSGASVASRGNGGGGPPIDLSFTNCPLAFVSFLAVWARTVPLIQSLAPQHQHDLARLICSLPPLTLSSSPNSIDEEINNRVNRIAHELRAVAIEISQRRTFQERYGDDLQAAIDAGGGGGIRTSSAPTTSNSLKANFVPPPMYDAAPSYIPHSSPPSSTAPLHSQPSRPQHLTMPIAMPTPYPSSPSGPSYIPRSPTSPTSSSILQSSPAISLIRETLYASLADVLSSSPYIRNKIKSSKRDRKEHDLSRVYFAAMGLAVLDVGTRRTRLRPDPNSTQPQTLEPVVLGILEHELTLTSCPNELKPFMKELVGIGSVAREMEEEDSERMVKALSDPNSNFGADGKMPRPRMDRVRRMIERGVSAEDDSSSSDTDNSSAHPNPPHSHNSRSTTTLVNGRTGAATSTTTRRPSSPTSRALQLANRVNGLALGMMKLRAFRERQGMVFDVLSGVRG